MKKLSFGITLLMAVCYFQSYAQRELLPNGSFEQGVEPQNGIRSVFRPSLFQNGQVPNWQASPIKSESYLISNSLMVSPPPNDITLGMSCAYISTNCGIFTDFNFQQGKNYKISFYVNLNYSSSSLIVKSANGLVNGFKEVNGSMPNVANEIIYQNNNLKALPITNLIYEIPFSKVTINYTPTNNYSQLWICAGMAVGNGNGIALDYVEIEKPCINDISPSPPSTFYIDGNATQGIGPIFNSSPSVATSIDARKYGGTVIFSGDYKVIGSLYLKYGNFIVKPGTRFFFYPSPNESLNEYTMYAENRGLTVYGTPTNRATLVINSAIFTSGTSTAWGGIQTLLSADLEIKGDICNTQISNGEYGIFSRGDYNQSDGEDLTKKIFIEKCTFVNNIRSSIAMGNKEINCKISKCLFLSNFGQLKTTFDRGALVNNSDKITVQHIDMFNGLTERYSPNYNKIPRLIEDCYFENSIYGIQFRNIGHKVQRNIFKNIAMMAYLNYSLANTDKVGSYYNAGETTASSTYLFQNNTIELPSSWPATPQLDGKTCYGIFNTMSANTFNNVITVANNASFDLLTRIGIYNASPFHCRYFDNSFTNLHQGLRLKTFNNGLISIERNNFVGNLDAIRIAKVAATSSIVSTTCNSFTNPAARAGTAAIRVEEEAFLNSLQNSGGGNIYPNQNAFSSMAKPIEFIGTNNSYAGFNYLRSTSAMENPSGPQISSTDPLQASKNFIVSPYAGGCAGTNTGAKRVGIVEEIAGTEGEAKEMLNQIRFKYVNAQDQNQYLRKVIAYYGVANKIGDLYNWQKPMNRFNKKAYNSLGLFLMDYFRAEGKETQAQEVANALLKNNASSKEIAARVKYFNLPMPTARTLSARRGEASEERDEVLKELAYSGTSVADLACILLRLNTTNADCPEQDATASNARSGNPDPEEEEDEVSNDTYLGNCLPNPAKDETVIYFYVPEEASKGILRINNAASGAFIKEYTVSGKDYITLNVADFASGVYTYTLQVNDIPITTKKLVVVK